MELNNYRERKAKGMTTVVAVSPNKVMASARVFNQFTAEEMESQESFFKIDALEAQRETFVADHVKQLAELDAFLTDAKAAVAATFPSEIKPDKQPPK